MSFMIDNLLKSDTTLSKNGTHRNAKIDHLFHTTFYRQQNEVFAPIFSKSSVVVNDNKALSSPNFAQKLKQKRRILFTREQIDELQRVFDMKPYLTIGERESLSKKVNLTPTQVKIWFQNHRYKKKKNLIDRKMNYEHEAKPSCCLCSSHVQHCYNEMDLYSSSKVYSPTWTEGSH